MKKITQSLLSNNKVHFPAYDLNGNVMELVNAANGIISVKYEYGPFGEVFCSVGDMAKVNPFGFSTKYTDNETDLLYYGYRYYSPALGRWLSRDPIEEHGGLNLYGFVNNDPVNSHDMLGLWKIERKRKKWALARYEGALDTKESLAETVRLNYSEFEKWARPIDGTCNYEVPNTVIVYTSKKNPDEQNGIGSWQLSNRFRHLAIKSGNNYKEKGYLVYEYLEKESNELFESLWKTDGIVAYAFAGHGDDEYGYVADPNSGLTVAPSQVFPPYHLQAIGAYACSTALTMTYVTPKGPNTTGKWRDWISDQGTFVGYTDSVGWLNVWWNEESFNLGIIP